MLIVHIELNFGIWNREICHFREPITHSVLTIGNSFIEGFQNIVILFSIFSWKLYRFIYF